MFGIVMDLHQQQVAMDLVGAMCGIIGVHILLLPYTFKTTPKNKKWVDMMDLYFHVIYIPILVFCAAHSVYVLGDNVTTRWHGTTTTSYVYQLLYCAANVVHLPILWFSKDCSMNMFLVYVVHHTVSCVSYGSGLFTMRMNYFACLDGLCEISSLFLNVLFTYQYLGLPRGKTYAVCGFLLWLSFLVFRIMLFPYWVYVFYTDVQTNPTTTWDTVSPIERYFYCLTNGILLVLSTNWFIPITKGMIKAIKGTQGSGSPSPAPSPKPHGWGQPKTKIVPTVKAPEKKKI